MATSDKSFQGDDPADVDPQHFSLELDNEFVRVYRAKLDPGEKTPMMKYPPMMTISITDRDIKLTLPNGRTQRLFARAGEVVWYDSRSQAAENMSAKPYEGVFIMLKNAK